MKDRIAQTTRSRYSMQTLDWLFEHPIFSTGDFVAAAGIPQRTARRLLALLREQGVLRTIIVSNGRRGSILAFGALLDLAEGQQVL